MSEYESDDAIAGIPLEALVADLRSRSEADARFFGGSTYYDEEVEIFRQYISEQGRFLKVRTYRMKEIIFEVIEEDEGGYSASALGYGIHTQGETVEELRAQVRDAIECYFDYDAERPHVVRLHFVRDEVMAL